MANLVVITGACGGLGREFVSQYVEMGNKVIGVDINDQGLLSMEEKYKDLFVGMSCNLLTHNSIIDLIKNINSRFGVPAIWINNAGIVTMDSFLNEEVEQINNVMNINFSAQMLVMKHLIPEMEKSGGGKIINVSSVAGIVSAPILSSYCASKFALVGLTQSVQQELDLRGSAVKLILVCPGFIKTDLIRLGDDRGFPEHLKPFLSDSKKAVNKIIKGIGKNESFIDPTFNGKFMKSVHRISPKVLSVAKKFALPKSLKELIKN